MPHTDEHIAEIIEDGECSEELHEALTVEAENLTLVDKSNINSYFCRKQLL